MKQVNVHEAKTNLSKLIEEVESGEEVVIARAGTPVVRLVKVSDPRKIRLGVLKGQVEVPRDFETSLPADLLSALGIESQ